MANPFLDVPVHLSPSHQCQTQRRVHSPNLVRSPNCSRQLSRQLVGIPPGLLLSNYGIQGWGYIAAHPRSCRLRDIQSMSTGGSSICQTETFGGRDILQQSLQLLNYEKVLFCSLSHCSFWPAALQLRRVPTRLYRFPSIRRRLPARLQTVRMPLWEQLAGKAIFYKCLKGQLILSLIALQMAMKPIQLELFPRHNLRES